MLYSYMIRLYRNCCCWVILCQIRSRFLFSFQMLLCICYLGAKNKFCNISWLNFENCIVILPLGMLLFLAIKMPFLGFNIFRNIIPRAMTFRGTDKTVCNPSKWLKGTSWCHIFHYWLLKMDKKVQIGWFWAPRLCPKVYTYGRFSSSG